MQLETPPGMKQITFFIILSGPAGSKKFKNQVFPFLYVPAGLKNLKNRVFLTIRVTAGLNKYRNQWFFKKVLALKPRSID